MNAYGDWQATTTVCNDAPESTDARSGADFTSGMVREKVHGDSEIKTNNFGGLYLLLMLRIEAAK